MSWTGNKRWTVPFVSLNGTACRVDIYEQGYAGTTVTELSTANASAPGVGAAEPFYCEEDDDSDLLSPIRIKTGYLNLVETVQDGLLPLYPTTNTQLKVELYYGTELAFCGFIQAQSYDNDWAPSPREVSLPVISTLGLMDGMDFAYKNTPSWVTLKDLMVEILNSDISTYESVIFPCIGENSSLTGVEFRNYAINSLVVSPFNDQWQQQNNLSEFYAPISFMEFLEGMCNCFGLTLHEYRRMLIFSKFDHDGDYFSMDKSGINFSRLQSYGSALVNLDEQASIVGDDNVMSTIIPLNKLTISYDGEIIKEATLNYDQCRKNAGSSQLTDFHIVRCTPQIDYLSSDKLVTTSAYVTSGHKLSEWGAMFCAMGKDSLAEVVLLQAPTAQQGSWGSGSVFKWTIYNAPMGGFRLKIQFDYGYNIDELSNPDWESVTPAFNVYIACGAKKWHDINKAWGDSSYAWHITGSDTHETWISAPTELAPIEVTVYPASLMGGCIVAFNTVQLNESVDIINQYIGLTAKNADRVIVGSPSPEDGSINTLFSNNAITDHRLRVISGAGGTPVWQTYNYMKQTQRRLQVDVNLATGNILPYLYPCRKYKYWQESWRWRMLAAAFYPRNDRWRLTLHSSPTQDITT